MMQYIVLQVKFYLPRFFGTGTEYTISSNVISIGRRIFSIF